MDPMSLATAGIGIGGLIQTANANADQAEISRESIREQKHANLRNLAFQRENLDYQKALQKDIFNREDTAVLRRSRDLASAGINPLLAAGASANAGAVVATKAPEDKGAEIARSKHDQAQKGIENRMAMYAQMTQVARTLAEIKSLEANRQKANAETRMKNHDLAIYQGRGKGVASTSSGLSKAIMNLGGIFRRYENPIQQTTKKVESKAKNWLSGPQMNPKHKKKMSAKEAFKKYKAQQAGYKKSKKKPWAKTKDIRR